MAEKAGVSTQEAYDFYEKINKEKTEKALLTFLRPEFINRVDEIITFNHLTEENFLGIADIMLKELSDCLADRGLTVTFTPDVLSSFTSLLLTVASTTISV